MIGIKKTAAALLMGSMLMPALAFADTSSTSSIQALLDQIKALQAQMAALQAQQQTVVGNLLTTLKQGDSGANVTTLQQLLAQDPNIFPEGKITGFFGAATARAVKRFQKRHGLEQGGNVGPKTLKKLNELFNFGSSTSATTIVGHREDNEGNEGNENHQNGNDNHPCVIGQGRYSAPGWLKNWGENGRKGREGREFRGREDERENCNSTTTPPVTDTTAPIISGVAANSITATGATITWNTNENATSQVEYGTTNSYGTLTTLNSSLVMSHSMALTGLTASTTYHYRVWSKDASNNTASSSDATFTTAQPADTTAPVISGVTVTGIGATTATISWNTDEAATGKVYYSTTTPVDLGTAASMTNTTLSTSHTFGLTGLTASSTYFFVVESKDAANNTATTSSQSFATL